MQLFVNGESRHSTASTLEEILDELGYHGACVATALNGVFIAQSSRRTQVLADGDALEILAPMQGG